MEPCKHVWDRGVVNDCCLKCHAYRHHDGDETVDDVRRDQQAELQDGFARALFVNAWAYACGEMTGEPNDSSIDCYGCGAPGVGAGEEHEEDCEVARIADEGTPGSGEDWMAFAPATSEHARKVARAVLEQIASENKVDLLDVYNANNALLEGHEREPMLSDFGHYLAMQWLGSGVSWGDWHPDHNLRLGYGEYMIHDLRKPEEGDACGYVKLTD